MKNKFVNQKKDNKSLKIIKKGFKSNEIVIYAIALMLVTAGYFNYTTNLDESVQTSSQEENIQSAKVDTKTKHEENKRNENLINETSAQMDDNANEENLPKKDEQKEKNDDDIGDAKLVNSDVAEHEKIEETTEKNEIQNSSMDYFVATKLERDTNYADMISTYTRILEDNSVAETQKAIAMKEIAKINDIKNSISVCENLLSTKGLKNYAILVNNDSVNVIVQTEDKLTKKQVAQIQNVVSREFNSKIENIHITEN